MDDCRYFVLNKPYNMVSQFVSSHKVRLLCHLKFDFPSQMTLEDALIACKKLGKGWRLPELHELKGMEQKKQLIGGFKFRDYWSSLDYDDMIYWKVDFRNGQQDKRYINVPCYVRAVKTY